VANAFADVSEVGNTGRVKLDDYLDSGEQVLDHPRHRAAQETLVEQIRQLRACTNVNEGYEFQQALLSQVLTVEQDHQAFNRAVKRMVGGKSPQAGAPEPQSGLDPALVSTWQLELDICERVERQFRCVGDALAWRVFGFEREYITALARNQSPGMMAGKLGLRAELALVEKIWKEDGQFALMHDLTNCLRIGDITAFTDERPVQIEVKTNAKRHNSVQNRRIKSVRRSLSRAGPLPGDDRGEWLYDLDLPYRTHLDLLRDGTERAARDGIFAAKVRGDRALLVTDLYGCQAQGWTEDQFNYQLERKFSGALRRAGLGPRQASNVHATSLDSVSRDPQRVPLASYPLDPIACARLIGDIAVFTVETSGPALAASVSAAGIPARWVWAGTGEIPPGQAMPLLNLLNYRGVEYEHLGCYPAGGTADLACLADGVLRGRALEEPVGLPQAPDAVVELAADLRGHGRHELPDLHGCLGGLADDAAWYVLEDLDEGDAVRVDPRLDGQPHDDPGHAVVHRQMRPHLLAHQLRVR
jgi:hypothetical protein